MIRDQHVQLDPLDAEIDAFESMKEQLEAAYMGKWVVFSGGVLWRSFDTFQDAAIDARKEFGGAQILIRQVGAGPVRIPSSLLFEEPSVGP